MEVTFCRGLVRHETQGTVHASWACTPFGILCLPDGDDGGLQLIATESIALSEPVADVDLAGADREGVEAIVSAILKGGHLDETGVKDRGEAVLFIMLNEVLHDLQRLREEEDVEGAGEVG